MKPLIVILLKQKLKKLNEEKKNLNRTRNYLACEKLCTEINILENLLTATGTTTEEIEKLEKEI